MHIRQPSPGRERTIATAAASLASTIAARRTQVGGRFRNVYESPANTGSGTHALNFNPVETWLAQLIDLVWFLNLQCQNASDNIRHQTPQFHFEIKGTYLVVRPVKPTHLSLRLVQRYESVEHVPTQKLLCFLDMTHWLLNTMRGILEKQEMAVALKRMAVLTSVIHNIRHVGTCLHVNETAAGVG